jgi:thiazole synthase
MTLHTDPDPLVLYGQTFQSRLLLGTARYPSPDVLEAAVRRARPAMLTASLRRQTAANVGATAASTPASIAAPDGAAGSGGNAFWALLKRLGVPVLPNTAGCHSVREVIATAQMARELFETPWIKLELIGDDYTLQPDPLGLVEAATQLIREGFKVLPYCTEDLVVGRKLLDVGCQALMPWGAPIGTGKGIVNPYGLRMLRERLPDVPLIVDAGLGLPSHACQVMEWGFDGVLLNTAVSQATFPARMAGAFAAATQAGRTAWLAGPMPERDTAHPSTAVVGTPFWHHAGAQP